MPGRVPSHVESLSWQITKGELIEDISVITQMGIGIKTQKTKAYVRKENKMKELIAVVAVIILGVAVGGVIIGFKPQKDRR